LYGKQQDSNPPRFLTTDEAFTQLLDACKDGTWTGHADELIIRLGLTGLRRSEIVTLTWGNLSGNQLTWTGKGHRGRTATLGTQLLAQLAEWRNTYQQQLGRTISNRDPIICPQRNTYGRIPEGPAAIAWGTPMHPGSIQRRLALRADLANLGHIAPHDLRRTAASILHNAKSTDGGHLFDLLDIQKVLGHADPATTMKCYIERVDRTTLDRAATVLD